jgi:ribosomal protein S3
VSLQRFYTKLPHIELLLSFISNSVLTANLVARYLATRLLQKFPIRRLLTVLIKQLKIAQNSALIHGFKIACNGRFERRGRATHT